MATLTWDNVGTREFETGVDRGVLYLASGAGVSWNGLVSISESPTGQDVTPLYFDGRKYLDFVSPKEFSGTITAFTYPDEFMVYEGIASFSNGIQIDNQNKKLFSLSYRTRIGNDVNENAGYKIHILYDLTAVPNDIEHSSISDSTKPIEFEWSITSRPKTVYGYRPTSHVIIDSTKISSGTLTTIEDLLYGTSITSSQLPSIETLRTLIPTGEPALTVINNGNGVYSISGSDSIVYFVTPSVAEIVSSNAIVIDATTIQLSTTGE
jgi:hypothetical protein